MRTKEEILKESEAVFNNRSITKAALLAMDEYAKEVAIAFAEWINVNEYAFGLYNSGDELHPFEYWANEEDEYLYDTKDLFDKFLSEQQILKHGTAT